MKIIFIEKKIELQLIAATIQKQLKERESRKVKFLFIL